MNRDAEEAAMRTSVLYNFLFSGDEDPDKLLQPVEKNSNNSVFCSSYQPDSCMEIFFFSLCSQGRMNELCSLGKRTGFKATIQRNI